MATIGSKVEEKALECVGYRFCEGLNLLMVKQKVETILKHVGNNGIFFEYTMHDITHVNGILLLYDRIIPEATKKVMTPADWLMIVLAAYFHDIGMFVTREEFSNRENNSDFTAFKEKKLKSMSNLSDIAGLSDDDKDRFWYQEYVRQEHGNRAHDWIKNCKKYNYAPCNMINEVLGSLDDLFLEDLALVCKSHTMNELPMELHNVNKAYGPTDSERVNLLYASVLLRTADLLHVTWERTPSDEYRIILPQNRISQLEWAKQKAVRAIDVKEELDDNGNPSINLRHSFVVQAKFNDAEGYFSFKDYILYAQEELRICKKWIQEERLTHPNTYLYPWDSIDTSKIQTEGFRNEKLKFEIDQKNILRLLTGHTLYNDSTVVLRELIQNAIDAGRLQDALEKEGSTYQSKVEILWNTTTRKLVIRDNGTGMDSHAITNYLLRVGSSKYQSDEFKKAHPDFHSISRFGIGLLTCFMISDDVDVYTLEVSEKKCHLLKIRNLHGEYLMREDAAVSNILEQKHGTTFELTVREEIDMSNIERQIRHWILLPFSKVTLSVDGGTAVVIGYQSTRESLEAYVQSKGIEIGTEYRIHSFENSRIEMSCLLHKNVWTDVWSLYRNGDRDSKILNPTGICVEGIRVTESTPGTIGDDFVAIVNCIGKNSPATNVARNALESGLSTDELYKEIYKVYGDILMEQKSYLESKYTPLWAISELNRYFDSLNMQLSRNRLVKKEIFLNTIRNVKNNVVDDGSTITFESLDGLPSSLSTLNCMAYKSAIHLLEDVHDSKKTAIGLLKELEPSKITKDLYLSLDNMSCLNRDMFMEKYEVSSMTISNTHWIQLNWTSKEKSSIWKHILAESNYRSYDSGNAHIFLCLKDEIVIENAEGKNAIVADKCYFLLKGSALYDYLIKQYNIYDQDDNHCLFLSDLTINLLNNRYDEVGDLIEHSLMHRPFSNDQLWNEQFKKDDIARLVEAKDLNIVNFSAFYH